MTDFDPDTFMSQQVDLPLATEFTLVPIGEYLSAIDDFDKDALEAIDFTYKRGQLAGTPGKMFKLTLPFVINDEKVKQELGRDKVTVTKQLILDIDEKGRLAEGVNRNVELGRIRDAVGQNGDGPWSISQLRGAGPVMVKVGHVEFERRDGTKGKRAEIEKVVRIV
jgi:hypothetical protein